jgi:nuclear RNA export factor
MTRSFDRTFIVLPGPNGSMIVASDILTVRAWAGSDAWKEGGAVTPQPSGTPAPAPVPTSQHVQPGIPPELNGLTPEQMAVVEKLMIETRLTPQYARMCAEQANFDLVRAAALFQQSRQQLPPSAFT